MQRECSNHIYFLIFRVNNTKDEGYKYTLRLNLNVKSAHTAFIMEQSIDNIAAEIESIISIQASNANDHNFMEILSKIVSLFKSLNSEHILCQFKIEEKKLCSCLQRVLYILNGMFNEIEISILFEHLNLSFWIEYQTFLKKYSIEIQVNVNSYPYVQELFKFISTNNRLIDRLINYCLDVEETDAKFKDNLENLLKILLFYVQKINSNIVYCLLPLLADSNASMLLETSYALMIVCIGYISNITNKLNTNTKYNSYLLKLNTIVWNIYKQMATVSGNSAEGTALLRSYADPILFAMVVDKPNHLKQPSDANTSVDTTTTNTTSVKGVLHSLETPKLTIESLMVRDAGINDHMFNFIDNSRVVKLYLRGVYISTLFNIEHLIGYDNAHRMAPDALVHSSVSIVEYMVFSVNTVLVSFCLERWLYRESDKSGDPLESSSLKGLHSIAMAVHHGVLAYRDMNCSNPESGMDRVNREVHLVYSNVIVS